MKKNFTFKTIFTVLALLLAITSYSQERCGMLEYMEEQLKDPEFAREHEEKQNKVKAQVQQILSNGDYLERGVPTIEVPVAVHFPTGNPSDRACLEALAQNQIDILNEDYSATNSDITSWYAIAGQHPNLTNPGVANITFCIATSNHPTFAQHGDPNLLEGNPAITVGVDFGGGNNTDNDWAGYLNFVIRDIGALGFSPLFGDIDDGDAVTMDNNAFASGAGCPTSGVVPQAPYNLGRTTTHELGHFFGLGHTFNADGGGSCGAGGDGIADTPEVANSTYGCPSNPTPFACNIPERRLTMNYMDYVNDACMYMFTPGQMTNVDAYITSIQADFKPNTCVPATPGFSLASSNSPISSCPDTDMQVTFDLTYTTILDFNETTTFTATGQPAGSTVSFSPTSLNNDGAFTMTVGNIGATAQGTYTITVTGTSSSVTETVEVELNNNCTEIVCATYASPEDMVGLNIADGNGGNPGTPFLTHIINVPDAGAIESMTVNVDVSHTWISDLIVRIIHPSGGDNFVDVWNGDCPGGIVDLDITFDDAGATLDCGNSDAGLSFVPGEALSTFNGMDAQGDWTILIADFFSGDTGNLNDWAITICTEQELSVNEFSQDSFAIFPNPNNGEFTIKLNSNSGNDIEVDVFDIRGRKIFKNSYTNTGDFNETVNLNNVQAGMYLVTVNDGNNKITKRIIVD